MEKQKHIQTSNLVSLKTGFSVAGALLLIAGMSSAPLYTSSLSASIIPVSTHASAPITPLMSAGVMSMGLFIGSLFLAIFVLYILAKTEGQQHGNDFYSNSARFAWKYFPSIFIIEALTLGYVLLITLLSTMLITKLYNMYESTDLTSDYHSVISAILFAVLGGALSQLYYFLNKVRPQDVRDDDDDDLSSKKRKPFQEFDINRVLKYLSFPFMSAGMGVMSYVIIKGAGTFLGMEILKNPSYWSMALMALTAGYFSEVFIIIFQKIIRRVEDKILPDEDDEAKPFTTTVITPSPQKMALPENTSPQNEKELSPAMPV